MLKQACPEEILNQVQNDIQGSAKHLYYFAHFATA
jgi:hypothetical protein